MYKSTPRPTETRDAAIRHVLRPIRGCATDDQYIDVSDRLEALLVAAERRTDAFDALVEALRAALVSVDALGSMVSGTREIAAQCRAALALAKETP